jgi:hypothetical protein
MSRSVLLAMPYIRMSARRCSNSTDLGCPSRSRAAFMRCVFVTMVDCPLCVVSVLVVVVVFVVVFIVVFVVVFVSVVVCVVVAPGNL